MKDKQQVCLICGAVRKQGIVKGRLRGERWKEGCARVTTKSDNNLWKGY